MPLHKMNGTRTEAANPSHVEPTFRYSVGLVLAFVEVSRKGNVLRVFPWV